MEDEILVGIQANLLRLWPKQRIAILVAVPGLVPSTIRALGCENEAWINGVVLDADACNQNSRLGFVKVDCMV